MSIIDVDEEPGCQCLRTLGRRAHSLFTLSWHCVVHRFQDAGAHAENTLNDLRDGEIEGRMPLRGWPTRVPGDVSHVTHINSIRKLIDVVEQRHSHISITMLLFHVLCEVAAVAVYLDVQRRAPLVTWRSFQWGTKHFVVQSLLSTFFMFGWIALLSIEAKCLAYVVSVSSLVQCLSSGWMLLLALGAVVTGSAAWTQIYAPIYLRLWSLHVCLLSLLDYPQVRAWFTLDRLQMTRSMVQCLAVIGLSGGTLQVVESYCGHPVGFFEVIYMMLQTFATMGYGDVTPQTLEGRALLIVFIGIGISYFIPLLPYIAALGLEHLRYKHYRRWWRRSSHVVLCGHFHYNDLQLLLKNFFAGSGRWHDSHVVVLVPEHPQAQVLLLLNSPQYRSSVTLLVGTPKNVKDLVRCDASRADALFLHGQGSSSSYYSDYEIAQEAMVVHARMPHTPLFVMLHRSRYTKSIMPREACVVEFERLGHNLLGLGCVLPGMIPLVVNLLRAFDPIILTHLWQSSDFADTRTGVLAVVRGLRQIGFKQRERCTYAEALQCSGRRGDRALFATDSWYAVYEASLAQQLEALVLPASQQMRTFSELLQLLLPHGVTAIGVVRSSHSSSGGVPMSKKVVHLAPRGDLTGVEKIIVLCDMRAAAQAALCALPPVRHRPLVEVPSTTVCEMESIRRPPPQLPKQAAHCPVVGASTPRAPGLVVQATSAETLAGHVVFVDLSSAHEKNNWSEEASVESCMTKAADYYDVMRPVRQHWPERDLVLLASEPSYGPLKALWECEQNGTLMVIHGCGLLLSDLQRCNLQEAMSVVIFAAGDRCDDHGDTMSILVVKAIQTLVSSGMEGREVPVIVEMDQTRFIPLLSVGKEDLYVGHEAIDWVMEPTFMSGTVICRHMLDTEPQGTYFMKELPQVLEQLLSTVNDSPTVTSLPCQPGWLLYSDTVAYCVECCLVPLAIHRLQEEPTRPPFRFIITNPPMAFPMESEDVVYCIIMQ